jgi:hypothetical protein
MEVRNSSEYLMFSGEKQKRTILHKAAKNINNARNEAYYIDLINQNKEFLEIKNPENNRPLQLAIKNNNYNYAIALLKCDARTKTYDEKGDECNILNTEEGSKVLCYFVLLNDEKYTDIIEFFLQKGADPHYKFNSNSFIIEDRNIPLNNTSAMKLSFYNRCHISLKIFINCGLNLNRIDRDGKTILDLLYESENCDGQPYLLLERAGAKRSSELTKEDDVKSILNNDKINNTLYLTASCLKACAGHYNCNIL